MISYTVGGSTRNTENFLAAMVRGDLYSGLERYGQMGVDALRAATPRESGATGDGWTYEIEKKGDQYVIWWINDHEVDGFNVAIGLQYGHGTGWGGWVQGQDYINPPMKRIFDAATEAVWKEVQRA